VQKYTNSKAAARKPGDPEIAALKIELIRQGLSRKRLAALVRLNVRTIDNIFCNSNRATKPSRAINRVLRKQIFNCQAKSK